MKFVVYGDAKPGGSKKAFRHPSTGRIIVTDASGKGGKTWRSDVKDAAREAIGDQLPLDVALFVEMVFYRPRPKGHFGSGRNARVLKPSAPTHLTTRPDVLKLARAVEDALTGIVWRDDSLIMDEHLVKRFGEPARVEIVVEPAAVSTQGEALELAA